MFYRKTACRRSFPKTSVFGKATLDLWEKAGSEPLFQESSTKLTEFWERLGGRMYQALVTGTGI
jgi:hypothetical protein